MIAGPAQGEQLAFNKTRNAGQVEFHYQWSDAFSQQQSLVFALPQEDLASKRQRLVDYRPHIAQQYVYVALMREAQQIDPREARVELRRIGRELKISVSSRSESRLRQWRETMKVKQQEAFDQYLYENYYTRFTNHLNQEGVKPDHVRYMQESLPTLTPIAQAIYDKLTPGSESRDYVNLLISWVQSIPYDELENRLRTHGAGYLPPMEVINQNLGDCDSKSTLSAGLMRSLLPSLRMVLVLLPGHALLGANLPHRTDEAYITYEGTDYLLMEPTGPRIMKIGEIADSSRADLAAGMYAVEVLP